MVQVRSRDTATKLLHEEQNHEPGPATRVISMQKRSLVRRDQSGAHRRAFEIWLPGPLITKGRRRDPGKLSTPSRTRFLSTRTAHPCAPLAVIACLHEAGRDGCRLPISCSVCQRGKTNAQPQILMVAAIRGTVPSRAADPDIDHC